MYSFQAMHLARFFVPTENPQCLSCRKGGVDVQDGPAYQREQLCLEPLRTPVFSFSPPRRFPKGMGTSLIPAPRLMTEDQPTAPMVPRTAQPGAADHGISQEGAGGAQSNDTAKSLQDQKRRDS